MFAQCPMRHKMPWVMVATKGASTITHNYLTHTTITQRLTTKTKFGKI
jgi:hypothetical protein